MSSNLCHNLEFLRNMGESSPKKRKQMLSKVNASQLRAIIEILCNIIYKNIKVSPKCKARSHRYRKTLKRLINPDVSFKQKKRILNQRGGNAIMAIILPAILEKLISTINKSGKHLSIITLYHIPDL